MARGSRRPVGVVGASPPQKIGLTGDEDESDSADSVFDQSPPPPPPLPVLLVELSAFLTVESGNWTRFSMSAESFASLPDDLCCTRFLPPIIVILSFSFGCLSFSRFLRLLLRRRPLEKETGDITMMAFIASVILCSAATARVLLRGVFPPAPSRSSMARR